MTATEKRETRLRDAQCAIICTWMAMHTNMTVLQILRYRKLKKVQSNQKNEPCKLFTSVILAVGFGTIARFSTVQYD